MRNVLEISIPTGEPGELWPGEGRKRLGRMADELRWSPSALNAVFADPGVHIGDRRDGIAIAVVGESSGLRVMNEAWSDLAKLPGLRIRSTGTSVGMDGRLHRYRVRSLAWQGKADRGQRWAHLHQSLREGLEGDGIPVDLRVKLEEEIARGIGRMMDALELELPEDSPDLANAVRVERVRSFAPMRLGKGSTALADVIFVSPLALRGYWAVGRLLARGCGRIVPTSKGGRK